MIQLRLADNIYEQWKSIRVTRSLEQLSGEFELNITRQNSPIQRSQSIKGNERAQILLHGSAVIDGHIEHLSPSYDAEKYSFSVSGRDITGDLVDSSAIVEKQELHNVTIAAAAEKLLAESNITVNCPVPGMPFEKFAINDGESIFETLKSHATQRGMLLYTQADGTLHIAKPTAKQSGVSLKEGINILSASIERDYSKIYHRYTVKAQGKGGQSTSATATDDWGRVGRNLIIHAERNENSSLNPQQRADWEKQSRRAAALRVTIKVAGWKMETGELWDINQLVHIESPSIDINQPLLTSVVEYFADDEAGTSATLTLVDPLTYAAESSS